MKKKFSLSDKIQKVIYRDMKINGFDNKGKGWKGVGLSISDVKEKIQNAQRKLKAPCNIIKGSTGKMILISVKDFDKIFKEEFGEKLTK